MATTERVRVLFSFKEIKKIVAVQAEVGVDTLTEVAAETFRNGCWSLMTLPWIRKLG